jgi:predicted lactoylglutathione lyase
MPKKLFVNLPVTDLDRSKAFFLALGLPFHGMTEDMASVVISEHTQVMLMATGTFAGYAARDVASADGGSEVILVVGLENPSEVDDFADRALAAGGAAVGEPSSTGGRYQRGFTDLDGHQWAALCLVPPS